MENEIKMLGSENWSEHNPYSIRALGKFIQYAMVIDDDFSFCLHESKRDYFSLVECIFIMENMKDIMEDFGGELDIILTRRF